MGVQLLAPHGADASLLAIARTVEAAVTAR
jgi:Asp-tRNA(Asn)/Glu-tRNA(Gln) amidotransferase A subunit family amidase